MQKEKIRYAPVLVTVYDRPEHFKQCIKSLLKNYSVSETTLFIFSDGPKDAKSFKRVTLVREYIKSIHGFKRVIPFTPKENTRGVGRLEVRDHLHDFSDRYIFSEDDNVFSPYFLNYMNSALDIYEEDERIHAISGYMFPGFPASNLQPLLIKEFSAWGVGYWRDKFILPDFNHSKFAKQIFLDHNLFNKINYGSPHLAPMLKQMAEGKLIAVDVIRSSLLYQHDCYCVFPSISMVRNIGNDGTGDHCGVNEIFSHQEICEAEMIFDRSTHLTFQASNQKWIRDYFGGRPAILRNKLIFLEMNTSNLLLQWVLNFAFRFTNLTYRIVLRMMRNMKLKISI